MLVRKRPDWIRQRLGSFEITALCNVNNTRFVELDVSAVANRLNGVPPDSFLLSVKLKFNRRGDHVKGNWMWCA